MADTRLTDDEVMLKVQGLETENTSMLLSVKALVAMAADAKVKFTPSSLSKATGISAARIRVMMISPEFTAMISQTCMQMINGTYFRALVKLSERMEATGSESMSDSALINGTRLLMDSAEKMSKIDVSSILLSDKDVVKNIDHLIKNSRDVVVSQAKLLAKETEKDG